MSTSDAIKYNVLRFLSVGLHKDYVLAPIIFDANIHFGHTLNVLFMPVYIEDCHNKFSDDDTKVLCRYNVFHTPRWPNCRIMHIRSQ